MDFPQPDATLERDPRWKARSGTATVRRRGSERTSGRAPAGRACGCTTTPRLCARSSRFSPSTAAPSRARSATGRTSSRARAASTSRCSTGSATSSTHTAELGLETIPTFIVGHMSGENWDPPWRQGRDLYRDVWLVSQQAWFAEEIARRFHRHPAVAGWLLSNEMPLYGGPAPAVDEVTAWARILVQAVRAGGATQPISLGDGAWGVEVSGQRQRLLAASPRAARRLLRAALVPDGGRPGAPAAHSRRSPASSPAAWASRSSSRSSASARTSPPTSTRPPTTARSSTRRSSPERVGWLAWNNCDYDDLRHQDPYRHHVFELHFGLTDARGRPKPQLRVLGEFAALVREPLGRTSWERVAGRGRTRRARALRAGPAVHRAGVPARTSATTCCRRTSPRARPTSRSSSCASATAFPAPRGSTSSLREAR